MRLCALGALVLAGLAGCGRNYFFGEREAWRREAEVECLKSGAVKENAAQVRIEPIRGPGMCGADFPLKVAALGGDSPIYGFAGELRPPGDIPRAGPKWPVAEPRYAPPQHSPPSYPPPSAGPAPYGSAPQYPSGPLPPVEPRYGARAMPQPSGAPMSITPPGAPGPRAPQAGYPARPGSAQILDEEDEDDVPEDETRSPPPSRRAPPAARPAATPVPLGTRGSPVTGSVGPVEVKPAATLACPIVSALDQWFASAVQPAARRWFGQPVVEIKQISAYSCRGMNGQRGARISEHAFGNALDIAAFTLADGRVVTVQDGWHGMPEEQGFLRDVQGAACERFSTVLAPGSNRFHYNHIHVDLMRRSSGRVACNPDPIPGEVAAARARQRGKNWARSGDSLITGSIAKKAAGKPLLLFGPLSEDDEEDEYWDEDQPRPRK